MQFNANQFYACERYGVVPGPVANAPDGRYGKALLIVVGADGEISDAEMSAFVESARLMGMPDTMLQELKGYPLLEGVRGAKLEDHLRGLDDPASARRLLYDCIMVASADGYSAPEQLAVRRVAKLLKVDEAMAAAIEGLVRQELALRTTRGQLFGG